MYTISIDMASSSLTPWMGVKTATETHISVHMSQPRVPPLAACTGRSVPGARAKMWKKCCKVCAEICACRMRLQTIQVVGDHVDRNIAVSGAYLVST